MPSLSALRLRLPQFGVRRQGARSSLTTFQRLVGLVLAATTLLLLPTIQYPRKISEQQSIRVPLSAIEVVALVALKEDPRVLPYTQLALLPGTWAKAAVAQLRACHPRYFRQPSTPAVAALVPSLPASNATVLPVACNPESLRDLDALKAAANYTASVESFWDAAGDSSFFLELAGGVGAVASLFSPLLDMTYGLLFGFGLYFQASTQVYTTPTWGSAGVLAVLIGLYALELKKPAAPGADVDSDPAPALEPASDSTAAPRPHKGATGAQAQKGNKKDK